MFLTAQCLDVEFVGTQHHVQIDLASVEALELIKPLAAGGTGNKGNSLYRYPHTALISIMVGPWPNVYLLGLSIPDSVARQYLSGRRATQRHSEQSASK